MKGSESHSIKLRKGDVSKIDFPQYSFEFYQKPIKPRLDYCKLLPRQQSPQRDVLHTTSCRIKMPMQQTTEHLGQKSLVTLPPKQISITNPNRSFMLKHKKPSIHERYKQIMNYNVEEQFIELRRLMSRQKKAFSLGRRVQFLQ